EVPEPEVDQGLQLPAHGRQVTDNVEGLGGRQSQQFGQGETVSVAGSGVCGVWASDLVRLRGIAGAAAVGANDVDVGQELKVEARLPGAVAAWAAQRPRVVGEVAGTQAALLRLGQLPVCAPQVVHDAAVGRDGGADVE